MNSTLAGGGMTAIGCAIASLLTGLCAGAGVEANYDDIEQPPHNYSAAIPGDRVSKLKRVLESGELQFDRTSEKAFLRSLLKQLGIPESSQLLVFSTTSLQLSLISPSNPRAIYFTEDVYVGFIPGGRIEIVSIDPDLGGIFYIFDIPRGDSPIKMDRSGRCMNCHASEETGQVPGLVIKSVIPGRTGGSINAFRVGQTGHQIPYEQRLGGWHVTGAEGFTNHFRNFIGRLVDGTVQRTPNVVGERFRTENYLVATSDLLPHLILEHQAGFVNRAAEANYRARTLSHNHGGKQGGNQAGELKAQIELLTRYLLLADEAAMPSGGIIDHSEFGRVFQAGGKKTASGRSLRELDLRTRLFRHRCSPMIYSVSFQGLNPGLKKGVYDLMKTALAAGSKSDVSRHIPDQEKQQIREILRETISDLPAGW